MLHWLCVQVFADPPCGTASGSYRPQCAAPYPPLIYPPTAEPLPPLPPARHQAGGVFCPSMKFSHAFYENHSFYVRRLLWYTKTISEGFRYISLRVPRRGRSYSTGSEVLRLDDPVCHVVAADHVSQPLSGSRTADSFFSFFMPSGSKSASLRMVTQRRTFCIFSRLSAGDIHYHRISSSHIHPCLYAVPSPHPVIFSTYFLSQHRCFHRFFLRRSADPPGSPPSILPTAPLFFRQLCSVPRPAILTVALSPSPLRYVCSFRKPPF